MYLANLYVYICTVESANERIDVALQVMGCGVGDGGLGGRGFFKSVSFLWFPAYEFSYL